MREEIKRQQKMLRVIEFEYLVFTTKDYIKTFRREVDLIKDDPQYPRAAQMLADIFGFYAEKSLLLIDKKVDEFNKEYQKSSNRIKSGRHKLKGSNLESRVSEFGIDSIRRVITISIEAINEYFKTLAALMRYIKTASIENVPQGLLYPFNNILKFLDPSSNLFLRKQSKHNYKYANFHRQLFDPQKRPDFFDEIEPLPEITNCTIAMAAYPGLCENNFLYNSNIAHEVGHYIEDLAPIFMSAENFQKKIVDLVDFMNGDRDKIGNEILRVAYYWYTEFIADIYATLLLGPAYLFSFIEFNLSAGEETLDNVHLEGDPYPSPRMRFYFILRILEHEEVDLVRKFNEKRTKHPWFRIISEKLEFIKSFITDEDFKFEGYLGPTDFIIAKKSWEINKSRIDKYIGGAVAVLKPIFMDEKLKNEIVKNEFLFDEEWTTDVEIKFKQLVPINEKVDIPGGKVKNIKSRPLNIYLILNYGWMRLYEILGSSKKEDNKNHTANVSEEVSEDIYNLKLLVKRSVEASYLHQQYNIQRERIG
jgi:hypothetical protein